MIKALATFLAHPKNKGKFLQTILRLLWWKYNQIFLGYPILVSIASGVWIVCEPDSSYGSFIVGAVWPEYDVLSFLHTFLQDSDVYIDVGAHIGDSSLLAAAKITKGRVIACEPTPDVYGKLMQNIRINNFSQRITALQVAIGEKVGTASFALEQESEINHLVSNQTEGKTISVDVTTIDQICSRIRRDTIVVGKIDVEGYELEVLLGAKKTLQTNKIQIVIFEANPRAKNISGKLSEIEKLLYKYDYIFFIFTSDGKLKKIQHLYVPTQTDNFVAIASQYIKTKRMRQWLV